MFTYIRRFFYKTRQRPSRALALYGRQDGPLDMQAGLDCVLMWVRKLGLQQAESLIWSYGGPNERQYKEFNLNAWLKGRVLPSEVCTSFELGSFVSGSERDLTDYLWYASVSVETNSLLFVVDLDAAVLADDLLCEMAASFQGVSSFSYGYAFGMRMEDSPQTFESGLLFGPDSKRRLTKTQENEISKWGSATRACGYYLDDFIARYLRDIYPLSFINPHHLAMQVKGQTLKDWIESDSKRGSLKPLIEGKLWSWTVPESRIKAVRKVLGSERLLISWGDFNTPSGGPLGHTYGAKPGTVPVFNGQALAKADERWIAEGLAQIKPLFTQYTGEPPDHFDKLIARREPLFAKLLDLTFTAWSQDTRPDRLAADRALQAFAAALGEHLVKYYRMGWYVVEDEFGRSLSVCHRGPGGSQTWAHPVDSVAKRIDRGETGFVVGVVEAVGEQIKRE